jgi:hypothetical protein
MVICWRFNGINCDNDDSFKRSNEKIGLQTYDKQPFNGAIVTIENLPMAIASGASGLPTCIMLFKTTYTTTQVVYEVAAYPKGYKFSVWHHDG